MPWTELAAGLLTLAYSTASALIALYALSQLHLLWVGLRRMEPELPDRPAAYPLLTVQLPLYNERTVVEALLASIGALEWPRDRLEVQVLDDSDDETVALAAEAVARLRAGGLDIRHLRRPDRQGYKAGALAWGLERARGELVAIFDADFRPRPDFLLRAAGLLERNPEWGLLQARWGHLNRGASVFTAAAAFHLDAHFTIEQSARSQAPLMMGFNGTAGLWRREAIEAAGGWSADTLTEDLDLSFRAQLAGWRLGYSDRLEAPAELPELVAAVRSQQHRWMKGGAQVSRKLLGTLWASERPLIARLQGTAHLAGGALFLCVFALCLASPAVGPLAVRVPWLLGALWPAALALQVALAVLLVFYGSMCVRREGGLAVGMWRLFTTFPAFLALSAGLSLHNGLAVLEGWSGRRSPFVRTPKRGEGGLAYVPVRAGGMVWAEVAVALWGFIGLLWALGAGQWVLAVFLCSQAAGFAVVAGASLQRA